MKAHISHTRRLLCLFCAVALLLSAAVFVSAEEIDYVDYFAALDKDPDVELVGSLSGELYRLLLLNPQGFMEELAFCSAELQQAVINALQDYCSREGIAPLKALEQIRTILYMEYEKGATKSEKQLLEVFYDALQHEYWRYPVQYRTDYAAMFQEFMDVKPNGAGTEYRVIVTEMGHSLSGNPAAFLKALAEEPKATQDKVFEKMRVPREKLSLLGNEDTIGKSRTELTDAQKALRDRYLKESSTLTGRYVVASGPVAEELAERNAQRQEATESESAEGKTDYVAYFDALEKDITDGYPSLYNLAGDLYRLLLLNPRSFMEELAFSSPELQQEVINTLMERCSWGVNNEHKVALLKTLEEIYTVLYREYEKEATRSEKQLLEVFKDALNYTYWRYPVQYRRDYAAMFQDLRDVKPDGAGTEYMYIDSEMRHSLCGNPAAFLNALAEESEETQDQVFERLCDSEYPYFDYFHQVAREILSLLGNEDTTIPEMMTELTDAQKALRDRFLEELPERTERYVVAGGPVAEELAERNAQKEPEPTETEPVPTESQPAVEDPKPESGAGIWIALGAVLAAAALGFLLGRKKKAA